MNTIMTNPIHLIITEIHWNQLQELQCEFFSIANIFILFNWCLMVYKRQTAIKLYDGLKNDELLMNKISRNYYKYLLNIELFPKKLMKSCERVWIWKSVSVIGTISMSLTLAERTSWCDGRDLAGKLIELRNISNALV